MNVNMSIDERMGIGELEHLARREDERWRVESELTWTLNLLDRVEDDTRRLWARMLRETKEARSDN